MTNLDSVLKNRDITLPIEFHILKAIVFTVVIYRCENWAIKKAKHWRIDAFKLWCWRRLLGILWTARRSKRSILKEINPEYSLEGLRLKLKIQYFGHLMWRADLLEKTLMLGKIEGKSVRWLDGHLQLNGMSLSKLREMVKDSEARCAAVHGVSKSWTQPNDWTATTNISLGSQGVERKKFRESYILWEGKGRWQRERVSELARGVALGWGPNWSLT